MGVALAAPTVTCLPSCSHVSPCHACTTTLSHSSEDESGWEGVKWTQHRLRAHSPACTDSPHVLPLPSAKHPAAGVRHIAARAQSSQWPPGPVPETVPSTLPAMPTRYSRALRQHELFPAPLRPRGTMA